VYSLLILLYVLLYDCIHFTENACETGTLINDTGLLAPSLAGTRHLAKVGTIQERRIDYRAVDALCPTKMCHFVIQLIISRKSCIYERVYCWSCWCNASKPRYQLQNTKTTSLIIVLTHTPRIKRMVHNILRIKLMTKCTTLLSFFTFRPDYSRSACESGTLGYA
jgi:hypothetical protein